MTKIVSAEITIVVEDDPGSDRNGLKCRL